MKQKKKNVLFRKIDSQKIYLNPFPCPSHIFLSSNLNLTQCRMDDCLFWIKIFSIYYHPVHSYLCDSRKKSILMQGWINLNEIIVFHSKLFLKKHCFRSAKFNFPQNNNKTDCYNFFSTKMVVLEIRWFFIFHVQRS